MALLKKFSQPNGIITEYHRISQVDLSLYNDETNLSVTVTSYLNKEYREAGHHIELLNYNFMLDEGEDENVGLRQLAYNKLKTLNEWVDAVDC